MTDSTFVLIKKTPTIGTTHSTTPARSLSIASETEKNVLQTSEYPAHAPSGMDFGQDFSRVAVQPRSANTQSSLMPSRSLTPTRCPFGGACHTCPMKVQAKLAISQPQDIYEQEADQITMQVMQSVEPGFSTCSEEQQLKRQTTQSRGGAIHPAIPIANKVGQPLEPSLRAFFESRFGYSFDQVRVHTDAAAVESARAIQARAYTMGHEIVFGAGEYTPGTAAGRRLIAHELTHVVQQNAADRLNSSKQSSLSQVNVSQHSQLQLQRTPAKSDCSPSDIAEINSAYPIAVAMVRKAIQVIGAPQTPEISALLRKYFNDDGPSTRLHALIGYRNLISGITGDFTIECEKPGSWFFDHFCGGSYAYVRANFLFAGNVHLCQAAFGRSDIDLAETIVHESSHKFDNTDDEAYCWTGCPASLDRWDAYDNADSYSKFARDAYTTLP